MSGQDAHNEYMQAASKIARIRTLMAELPAKLEEAKGELAAAVETLGADPLNLMPKSATGRKTRGKGEAERMLMDALPGTVGELAIRTGLTSSHVNVLARKLLDRGQVMRTGQPGVGVSGGYVYSLPASREEAA